MIKKNKNKGFTLLEVILAIGILSSLTVISINILTSQIENRDILQNRNDAFHELNQAMQRVYEDLRYAFVRETKQGGRGDTIFIWSRQDKKLFTESYPSYIADTPQSSIIHARYQVSEPMEPNKPKQLVRFWDSTTRSKDMDNEKMQKDVIIEELKTFEVMFWDGIRWQESWDSTNRDTVEILPKLAKIKITSYIPLTSEEKQLQEIGGGTRNTPQEEITLESIVYILSTKGKKQPKEPLGEFKWQLQ